MIEYPLRISCDLQEIPVVDGLALRKMQSDDIERLLNISDPKYSASGQIDSYTILSRSGDIANWISNIGRDLDEATEFASSNYVLQAESDTLAHHFNYALKLMGDSCTALLTGFESLSTGGTAKHFLRPTGYVGTKALSLGATEVSQLSFLTGRIASLLPSDGRLATMLDLFLNCNQSEIRTDTQYLETCIVLEMLLLPKQNSELAFRFSLRFAKMLAKLRGDSQQTSFALAKKIYAIRSKVAHSGTSPEVKSFAKEAVESSRVLLREYVAQPDQFDDAALDDLCLT